jgi:hypothetical protein
MKNIYKFLTLFLTVTFISFFQSCDDNLEIDPNSSLIASTAFKNVDDLQNALNSAYTGINNTTILLNSVFTDNTKVGIDNGGQQLSLHTLIMDSTNGEATNIWISRYSMINIASRIMEAYELIDKTAREQEARHILGQAYALRAFAHFELFQYFTPDYLNGSGLSVPAVNQIITVENLPRNTVSEVLGLIDNDLTTSAGLLDNSKNDNKYVTQDFLTALRTRVSLFSGEYVNALGYANQLIAKYPLANANQYRNMYLDSDNTEVIFKSARVFGDDGPGFIWHFTGGGPNIEMSNSLFNLLDPLDVRYDVLLNVPKSDPTANFHLINKYPGTANEFLSDVKVFRVSEMYLAKAEAQIRASQFDEAKITLKTLRDARFNGATALPVFSSIESGLDFLLTERRIELAYESHRYLDLKRFGKNLERDVLDCGDLDNACQILSTDQRFTLPIPLLELNANDLMVQNTGY